jgi:hypothetical protein
MQGFWIEINRGAQSQKMSGACMLIVSFLIPFIKPWLMEKRIECSDDHFIFISKVFGNILNHIKAQVL